MKKINNKEVVISLAKSVFSAIPFAGGVLNELAFDYRSRIKQNRLNNFVGLLSDFFTVNPDIDPQSLKTEEFSDLFESVIRCVLLTKSREKHERFRDVLIRQVRNPHQSIENSETFLDLISTINEISIWILKEHLTFSGSFAAIDPLRAKVLARVTTGQEKVNKMPGNNLEEQQKREKAKQDLQTDRDKVENYNELLKGLQGFRKAEHYGISSSEFLYYKQTLYAKGLLVDKGFGTHGGSESFLWMWITAFGEKFMEFILDGETNYK